MNNTDDIIKALQFLIGRERELSMQLIALKNQSAGLRYVLKQNEKFGRISCAD